MNFKARLNTILLLSTLSLAGIILRGSFFHLGRRYLPVSSDEAITVLQAKRISEGQTPLFFMGQPYLFPTESYLQAPFVRHLPRTPWAARLIPFLMGLAGMLCSMGIAFRLAPARAAWPGLLLIALPSGYLLMHQAAYALPGYPTLLAGGALTILLALHAGRRWCAAASGFVGGVAFSTHMLALPAIMAAGCYCLSPIRQDTHHGSHKPWRHPLMSYLAGLAIGLLPWLTARQLHTTAHGTLMETMHGAMILRRLWSPAISHTLPGAMGTSLVPFPDNDALRPWPAADRIIILVWLAVLAIGVLLLTIRLLRPNGRSISQRLSPFLPFYIMTAATMLIFAATLRANSNSFRYLLPAVWCFPFLVLHLHLEGSKPLKFIAGSLAVSLVTFNLYAGVELIRLWKTNDFADRHASLPDLQPAIAFLEGEGIRHCVASYGAAYRINFMTDEQILCSQPFNERFPWWPTPYKETVDQSTKLAYVLTDRIRFLKPSIFDRHLDVMNMTSARMELGAFTVYHDFRERPATSAIRRLPGKGLVLSASQGTDRIRLAADGDFHTEWSSAAPQAAGMWLEIELPEPLPVCRVLLLLRQAEAWTPPRLNVHAQINDRWQPLLQDAAPGWDKFRISNGQPVYGIEPRVLEWPAVTTDRLRLEIQQPDPDHPWAIGELEIHYTGA